ncbi:hypothetical protein NP233_g11123 [Leucocoprinus birnbaumii]|uniref:Uncharacterized protein n=1 Tax=Leucocoprinus birnbaumii TaxID=56174 RepID=A0AAD5VH49_9AGAR|nr:hypothetical protein NP233_g11123 [Leucocoprinus birnbaumii]
MLAQPSHFRDEPVPAVEEEWQIISPSWWRTDFGSVSWSYRPEKADHKAFCAKPPHYHLSLHKVHAQRSFHGDEVLEEPLHTLSDCHSPPACRIAEDNVLNEELIGVKNTREVLKIYEQAVGFDYSPWPDLGLENGKAQFGDVSEADVELGKERWNELVHNLFGRKSLENLLIEAKENPKQNSRAVPSTSIDYFSRPSTPKAGNFQLNPSASSFVPLGSPTSTFSSSTSSSSSFDSSDHLVSFSFPSLNASLPPPPNKPERQEYVNILHTRCRTTSSSDGSSVASNERPSSGFLPPFLFDSVSQRRRPTRISRTRAIVDQLRSQHHQQHDGERMSPVSQDSSPTISDFGVNNLGYFKSRLTVSDGSSACSTTPPLTEEEFQHHDGAGIWTDNADGWTIPPTPSAVDPETKRTRSKELLMTLRRRTDSLTSNVNAVASLAAARSLGAVSASTPPVIISPERLVESPEPEEDTVVDSHTAAEQDAAWFQRSQTYLPSNASRISSPALQRRIANAATTTSEVDHAHPAVYAHPHHDTATRAQASAAYAQTFPNATNATRYPQGYIANPASGLPYPLMGYPMPVPSNVSMGMGVVAPMHPRGGMQYPIQVPVQAQYSTLMHLRIMQQMQMMRNSMGMNGGVGTNGISAAGVSR